MDGIDPEAAGESISSETAREAISSAAAERSAESDRIGSSDATADALQQRQEQFAEGQRGPAATIANGVTGDTPPLTPEDLEAVDDAATDLANEAGNEPDSILQQDTPPSMEGDSGDNANARLRPFMEWATDRYSQFVESRLPSDKLAEYKKLQNDMEEAAKDKSSDNFKTAREAMEKFIDDNFGDIKDAMRERSDNPPDPKKWEVAKAFLKLLGIFGVLGGLAWFFSKNNGCWKVEGGAMSEKINVFDFSKKPQYCACGPNSATVTNLDECEKVYKRDPPEPGYVTCPDWSYPACTVMDGDGNLNADGIYYLYYVTSPIGEWNNIVNQGGKLTKKAGEGLLKIVQWGILIGSLLMAMFLAYQGVQKKSGAISYYVMAGVLLLVGILGYWYIGTQIK